ncbi:MAG: hypothetical protein IK096_01195 [Lachnospiraceae bacterium]|nr:hypothetical protein [Lachnospiraceae bacterium]
MRDLEKMIRDADFSAGSDHKERLHAQLFSANAQKIQPISAGVALSDDELDQAAGGTSSPPTEFCPWCKKQQVFIYYTGDRAKCSSCGKSK